MFLKKLQSTDIPSNNLFDKISRYVKGNLKYDFLFPNIVHRILLYISNVFGNENNDKDFYVYYFMIHLIL